MLTDRELQTIRERREEYLSLDVVVQMRRGDEEYAHHALDVIPKLLAEIERLRYAVQHEEKLVSALILARNAERAERPKPEHAALRSGRGSQDGDD